MAPHSIRSRQHVEINEASTADDAPMLKHHDTAVVPEGEARKGTSSGAALQRGSLQTSDSMQLNEEFAAGPKLPSSWHEELNADVCADLYDDDPGTCCRVMSAVICGVCFRAKRLGNMPVLLTRRKDDETQLICLLGPFW